MPEVEEFIFGFEDDQGELLHSLHYLLADDFDLTPKIKYKIPFYYNRSWICYLNPLDDNSVELAFTRGNELSNIQGLLRQNGRKQVSGIVLKDVSEVQFPEIREIIQEAIVLDETIPYRSKRKK